MNHDDKLRLELMEILRGLGGEATSLYAVGVPMVGKGFGEHEIVNALMELDREKVIELLPGNQMRVLQGRR
ncbi:hypothetical protein [Pararhizobium sp. DWP3-4]|uniref:hypothetical protein n=1 Tax=unclassified Pararhizobium TaxID=2643050 RepID=UPI003CE7BFA5